MTPWQKFNREKLTKIFTEKKRVIDIGGSLRLSGTGTNWHSDRYEWIRPLVEKVEYKVLDPVAEYGADIVGDIHQLPFKDNEIDAYLCIAVMEHIENPHTAASEMYRTLKPGGYLFVYVPFLYPYHAERGYYGDFWRYTEDSLRHLFKGFSSIEICNVRGALETWIYLSPLRTIPFLPVVARVCDRLLGKTATKQTSGYNVFLVK